MCGRYGGGPRQRCQNVKTFKDSNDVGTYLDGWGMSIATQQAKERQNRTPNVEDMTETRNQLKPFLN